MKYPGTSGDGSTTLAIGPQPEVEVEEIDSEPEEEDMQMNRAAFSIMQDAGLPMGVNSDNSITLMSKGKFKCRACNLNFLSKQLYGKHRKTEDHKANEKKYAESHAMVAQKKQKAIEEDSMIK